MRSPLEIIAPHDPDYYDPDYPDPRGFWARIHEAEENEGRPALWERHLYLGGPWLHPTVDVYLGWGITQMGIGADFEVERAGTGYHGSPGSLSWIVRLGPLFLSVRHEWLSHEATQKELDEDFRRRGARKAAA